LLWVRGQAVSKTSVAIDPAWLSPSALITRAGGPQKYAGVRAVNGPGTFVERVIDRAIKALNLVVQSGVCTLVVIDLIDVPAAALRRLPAATWFRIERAIEGSDTAVLIVSAMPMARSTGGRSIALTGSGEPAAVMWRGEHDRTRRLAGVRMRAKVSAARWSHGRHVDTGTSIINAV
jgi:hypothetical protein